MITRVPPNLLCTTQGRRKGGGGGHWIPQFLADQLTLFKPGGTDYAHQITTAPSPQIFEASAASEFTS